MELALTITRLLMYTVCGACVSHLLHSAAAPLALWGLVGMVATAIAVGLSVYKEII